MGKQGLTRRGLTAAIAVALPSGTTVGSPDDPAWVALVHDLRIANERWAAAMANLNEAERRYVALPRKQRRGPEPAWYAVAQQAEADAAAIVDKLHLQIARTRAHSREGLALKVRLLAAACGEDPDNDVRDNEDLVSCLVRSLIDDLAG